MNGAPDLARRLLRGAAKLALVGALAGAALWWLRFSPVDVTVHRVATGTVVARVMGTGTLEARVRAGIGPEITGRLTRVIPDQGDRVARGGLVATLDDGDLRQRVEIARADLDVARAGLARAAGTIVRAEAVAVQARASHARTRELAAERIVSSDELDVATQQRDTAEADLALARLAKAESEAMVARARENLRYEHERLAQTRISAPFDALVIAREREPGDVVVPGATILDVVSTDELWISAWVDETALGRLSVGQPAQIVFRSDPETPLPGRLARIAPRADAETREFLVDVTIDALPATWAIGQRAEVYIETARRADVVALPQRLLVWREDVPGVLIDDAGRARWTRITLGLRGDEQVEVSDGLAAQQFVIGGAAGTERPRQGRRVRRVLP